MCVVGIIVTAAVGGALIAWGILAYGHRALVDLMGYGDSE